MEYLNVLQLICIAVFSCVLIGMQMFFCTRKNIIFLFVLPTITFVASVIITVINFPELSFNRFSEDIVKSLKDFFILNIPTIVLIAISFITRKLHKKL